MFSRSEQAICALLLCALLPGQAGAQTQLSAAQVFDLAQQLVEQGDTEHAVDVLKVVTQDRNPDYRAEARVRIARYLAAKGDKRGALRWYRALLDERPDTAAVRIEVALILASLGEEQAAAGELRRAEASGLPQDVSRAIHNASAIFWNRRPFGVDLSVGLAPDTNINSATSSDTVTLFGLPFQLSNDAKAHSGVGATFDGSLALRRPASGPARLVLQANVSGRLYRDSRFNDVTLSASAGPELSLGKGVRVRPALLLGRRMYGVDRLYDFYGLSSVAQLPSGKNAAVTFTATLTDFHYTPSRHNQSGLALAVGTAYDRALSPRLAVRAGLTAVRAAAIDSQFATKSLSGDLTLSRDVGHWTVWTRGSWTALKGDANYAFFGVPRDDRIIEANIGLVYRRLSVLGFSPQIKATFLDAASSLPLFRYRRLRSEFSVTKSF